MIFFLVVLAFLVAGIILLYINQRKLIEKDEPVTETMVFVEGMNYSTPVPIPDEVSFAGELVPAHIFYVREQLDRELTVNTYWHSSSLLMLKRATRWFPLIEPILQQQGIPDDFKYLALIESGLLNVVSPSGAAGYWQFLEKTGKEYGLIITKEVDERYHAEKATRAACDYLNKSYAKFGNWTLVAASYNAGQKRIEDAVSKQYSRDFYELHVNDETSRYIYRILAMKYICRNPILYGFKLEPGDYLKPHNLQFIPVTQTISDLPAFARSHKISYRMLKELNPWLRSDKLTVKRGERFEIALPGRH